MEGGPPIFPTGSTCPQVLGIQITDSTFRLPDSHRLRSTFPCRSATLRRAKYLSSPERYFYPSFGLRPISLATTLGISVDFFSSAYLDVSVQRVPFLHLCIQCRIHGSSPCGFPHSEICGSKLISSSPQLIAGCRVLLRLLVPRHSPYALFRLNSFLLFSQDLLSLPELANNCFFWVVN